FLQPGLCHRQIEEARARLEVGCTALSLDLTEQLGQQLAPDALARLIRQGAAMSDDDATKLAWVELRSSDD
ncbi:MAG TPA: hypothetical protein VFR86_13095, partial [Burkholderiaceae bacterium]|nr:hypothetical protein [Burkholderiaceae bacterium]